ncbi:unnamed protein product [Cochlearia groenlandica]
MMEETDVTEDSSDVEFACGVQKVEPRVGDEFQVEIPPMMSLSKRALFRSSPIAFDDSSYTLLVGLPIQVMWVDKHPKGDDNVDMNQSLRSLRAKRSRCSSKKGGESDKYTELKKQRVNLEAVPGIPSSSWVDIEVDSFVLGLYTYGKNFAEVKKFMESKGTGEIVLYYYAKFYNSIKYHIWSDSRKKRSRKCVYGRKLYSGWRQQQLLSRLIPSITDESQRQMLVNVSKSFAEGKIVLEKYVSAVKDLVGLKLLVEAVAIGKGKDDLTVLTAVPMKTKPWFTVTTKTSSVPGFGAYTSLTSVEIINQLTGSFRLSKARCNDIFWEAVWPRLLARGWHSEQTKDRGYFTSKDSIVFIVPGVKRFSRGKHVKGDHYFDSVSDILTKVALEPELLEFETGGEIREAAENDPIVAKESSDQSDDEESPPSDSQRHRYLRTPCSKRATQPMKFTVVDTSLAAGEKLCGLRNLKAESLVSEPKTRIGEKHSSVLESSKERHKVKNPQRMSLDAKKQVDDPMRFTIIDTSLDKHERLCGFRRWRRLPGDDTKRSYAEADSGIKDDETSEKVVKDSSRRLIKHKFTEESNYHSVSSASLLKRRRLSACIRSETNLSRESPESKHLLGDDTKDMVCSESNHLSLLAVQRQNSTRDEMNEDKERDETLLSVDYMNLNPDQSKEVRTGPSSSPVEIQEMSVVEPNGINSSKQEPNGQQSSNDLEPDQAVELPSISDSDNHSNDLGTTQELDSSKQQQKDQQSNTDGPRRQSTRKRPLTTRALEAIESGFLTTTNRVKSTSKPRKRESATQRKQSAKAQVFPDNVSAELKHRGEHRSLAVKKATASKLLDEIKDSKPSFVINETTTENKVPSRIQESKPVLHEHHKLPPIVLKLSLKRHRGDL